MKIDTSQKTITFSPDEGFGALLEAAEFFGWEDNSAGEGEFTPSDAEGLDQEARAFIESKGYEIVEIECAVPDSRNEIFETVWNALHGYREDSIPEGDENYDDQWSEICTAMAWLQEHYGCPEKMDDRAPEVIVSVCRGVAELVSCADDVLVSLRDYDIDGPNTRKTMRDSAGGEYVEIGNNAAEAPEPRSTRAEILPFCGACGAGHYSLKFDASAVFNPDSDSYELSSTHVDTNFCESCEVSGEVVWRAEGEGEAATNAAQAG